MTWNAEKGEELYLDMREQRQALIGVTVNLRRSAINLASALERCDANLRRAFDRKPIRDLAETYAETEAALSEWRKLNDMES